ncbi:MAG: phosphate propanoyltransferase [Armatimonadetes bacterium]|nr:phosphate propanoyltransferase [Armatimonadota bacterium]
METLALLRDVPLFGDFSDDELADLLSRGELKHYRPGERIIRCGDPGSFLGVVLEGTAQALRCAPDGEPVVLGDIPTGAYFGEISLISGDATTAHVVAETSCRILEVPHQEMSEVLIQHPAAMKHVARTIALRLRPRTEEETRAAEAAAPETPDEPQAGVCLLAVSVDRNALRYEFCDLGNEMNNFSGEIAGLNEAQATHSSAGVRWEETETIEGTLSAAAESMLKRLRSRLGVGEGQPLPLTAIGYRVPHGGEHYSAPAAVDPGVCDDLAALGDRLCPADCDALAAIEAFAQAAPDVPQVAAFDTAFFAAMPPAAFMHAAPYEWYGEHGLRRYGRDGLVHQQAVLLAAAHLHRRPEGLNLIVCNLAEAPSVCAVANGRGVDVSPGLTDLATVPGATTAGDTDLELILRAPAVLGLSEAEVTRTLQEDAGLWALSGLSGDLPDLLEFARAGNERAGLAADLFCHRVRKLIGAYFAVLGRVDALVFTGAWGMGLPALRARICNGLAGLGLELDDNLNSAPPTDARGVSDIARGGAATRLLLAPTDRHRMVAAAAAEVVGHGDVCAAILARRRPIPIGVSVRHVHLSKEHVEALYGPGHKLTFRSPLSQPGQFACEEVLDIVGVKGRINGVRVLGPERPETQVEVSRTECFQVGVRAPIRMSGELDGTPGLSLAGPAGEAELDHGAICARRHLHASPEEAMSLGLRHRDEISVRVGGERSLVFNEVAVRVHPDYRLDMHIDTDEANAARLDQGAVGYVESVDLRV